MIIRNWQKRNRLVVLDLIITLEFIDYYMKPKKTQPTEKDHKAAICIQKHYRGFVARKNYPKMLKRYRKKNFTARELIQS